MLSFDYTMELDFEGAMAGEHAFTLRCLPQETADQHIDDLQLSVMPACRLSYGTDSFGTRYCYGLIHQQHSRFQVRVSGRAERFPDRHEIAAPAAQMLYRQMTDTTRPGPVLRRMAKTLEENNSQLQRALAIRDLVHQTMTYVPGSTNPSTSAEEAAASGKGVCQDYAHIMLALCRMQGIPCRYTAGLLLGEGVSHAWVEVCINNSWQELDPTNPDADSTEHLIFSHGRDAADCEINRGVFLGPSAQIQKVRALLLQQ